MSLEDMNLSAIEPRKEDSFINLSHELQEDLKSLKVTPSGIAETDREDLASENGEFTL